MGVKHVMSWVVSKLYNIGASIVIAGLITEIMGYGFSKTVVIVGLFAECLIFLLSALFVSEGTNTEDKKEDMEKNNVNNNKYRKIYYMNEDGNYYVESPNYIQASNENPTRVIGVPYQQKQAPLEYYSISAEIQRLSEKLEQLKAIQDEEMKKYMADNKPSTKRSRRKSNNSETESKKETSENKKRSNETKKGSNETKKRTRKKATQSK